MDGLLLDTEDIYTKCNNVILQEYGRPNLPWKIKAQLQGRPATEASTTYCPALSALADTAVQSAKIFHAWARLPIPRPLFTEKQRALQSLYFPTARPLPGVPLLLKTLKADPDIHLALASSSNARNFHLKTSHHQHMFEAFEDGKRVLGDDPRVPKGRGKPCPDIYLLALETINAELRARGESEIERQECLVFEDSVLGVEAGRRAGMRVVWCPHPELWKLYKGQQEEVLAGVANGWDKEYDRLMDSGDDSELELESRPGVLGDGWAVKVETLEAFDYARYGIGI